VEKEKVHQLKGPIHLQQKASIDTLLLHIVYKLIQNIHIHRNPHLHRGDLHHITPSK
jgi:hypothetical protein